VARFLLIATVAAAAAVAFSPSASAQQLPLRDLPKPVREIDEPFTVVTAAREISGGRVVVADVGEQQISIVDFTAGSRKALGRKGGGPGEYTGPAGVFRLNGDTIWVIDAQGGAGRFVAFLPNGNPGTTFPFVLGLDPSDSTTITAPWGLDARGTMYATALPLKIGTAGNASDAGGARANIQFSDSAWLVKFDPRVSPVKRSKVAQLRWFSTGKGMQQQVVGQNVKMTMPYPGLAPGDSWAVFDDGRIAIVRGANYRVDMIMPTGRPGASAAVPYEHFKVGESDKKTEMDAAKKLMQDQMSMVKKMLPPGFTMEFELLPPPSWPAEYPPVTPGGVIAGGDGRLWVRRAIPARIGREQWDVIDATGKLVARWQLPPKTTIVAAGHGVVYTVRTDEDDLRYLQRVVISG
jgi:hypothetical protein